MFQQPKLPIWSAKCPLLECNISNSFSMSTLGWVKKGKKNRIFKYIYKIHINIYMSQVFQWNASYCFMHILSCIENINSGLLKKLWCWYEFFIFSFSKQTFVNLFLWQMMPIWSACALCACHSFSSLQISLKLNFQFQTSRGTISHSYKGQRSFIKREVM